MKTKLFVAVLAVVLSASLSWADSFNCNANGEHCKRSHITFRNHIDLGQPYRLNGGTGVVIAGYHYTLLRFDRVEMLGLGIAFAARKHTTGENFITLPILDLRIHREEAGPDTYISVQFAQKLASERGDQDHVWIGGLSFGW